MRRAKKYIKGRIELESSKDFIEWREGSGDTLEIYDIAVGTKRSVGRGSQLVKKLIKEQSPRVLFAITRQSNIRGRKFYKKNGFQEIILRGFYSNENAVMEILLCR